MINEGLKAGLDELESGQSFHLTATGCDDRTVTNLILTPQNAAFLGRIAAQLNQASTSDCQPTLELKPGHVKLRDDDD